jgi:hypothetical protein
MHLFEIIFPVFAITPGYRRVWEDMNILYIETNSGIYTLDNKNIRGDTVGSRRLKIKNSELYIPRKVYYNIGQMLHSKYRDFMDTSGRYFKWKKSISIPLRYHKVSNISNFKDECIIHLKDIFFPQKVNCRLASALKCVGVLHTQWGYVLYEFSDTLKKNTYRKI